MAEKEDKDDPSGKQDAEEISSEQSAGKEKMNTEESGDELAKAADEEEEREEKNDEAGAEEDAAEEIRKRPLAVRILLGLTKFCLFLILYVTLGAVAAGGGFGWYYLDENFHHDLTRVEQLSTGAEVVDTHGVEIGRIGATDRKLITREDIPDTFIDALLAAEDQRFHRHIGFDPIGTLRAALANYRAEAIKEGGSTLTQQLARDVFGLDGKDVERKLNEIAIAFWI
ncbi:MAG: biosynthetic peptidoglycan transglycosylase, partial [Verrucomicrobiota bacterium]